jgi:acyl-CoA synthetase (AMP-forming)/AMP-acid ligase II
VLLPRDFVVRCTRSFPEKVAYIDAERILTWRQVNERSDRLAAGLQRLGIGKGDVVAILAHDQVEMVEHWYACSKIGALRTGINWRYAPREMLHIIRDTDAKAIFVQASCVLSLADHLSELQDEGRRLIGFGEGHSLPLDYEVLIQGSDASPKLPKLRDDDLIAVSYTTGTTGLPKGALWTQRNVREMLIHTIISAGFRHEDVWLNPAPGAGIPMLYNVFGMVNGMTTVLPDGDFKPTRCLELMEQHRVTSTVLVVTMLRRLVEEARAGSFDTSSLRLICYGAMPATPALLRAAYETFGCEFQQWYGSTESTGGFCTLLRPEDHRKALAGEHELLASIGTPTLHAEVSVRDPESGDPVPVGEIGEVWVAGDIVMRGYLNRPEDDAEAFSGRWLRMGDMALVNERGYLFLKDRKKFLIISGGYNVYPTVVENVLAEHPAVREVAVVGAPHPMWGEAVVAVASLKSGSEATPEELIDFCRDKLGKWEVPKHVKIVPELPKGATGKLLKHELRDGFRVHPELLPWGATAHS